MRNSNNTAWPQLKKNELIFIVFVSSLLLLSDWHMLVNPAYLPAEQSIGSITRPKDELI